MVSPTTYAPASWYFGAVRLALQDEIEPYRYTDDTLEYCINSAIREVMRLRPDIFLDGKYQQPLRKGDLGKGSEDAGVSNDSSSNQVVPIPAVYMQPVVWYAAGSAQFLDVADAQDQRAAAFMQKFVAAMMTVAA
jgi:hypothetical protein